MCHPPLTPGSRPVSVSRSAADAALAQTLEGVLEDGGMALPTPAEALDACLNDEACDVEEEAKLRAQELSMQ